MGAWLLCMVAVVVLCIAVLCSIAWLDRRSFGWYRRWCGGRWARVRFHVYAGQQWVQEWKPEAEVRGEDHVLEWEDERTRVRRSPGGAA
jgi:hypothetical protein